MTTLSDIGEAAILEKIAGICETPFPGVALGVGDDAALLEGFGAGMAVSTDMMVEGEDFLMEWAGFRDIGHKVAVINLSDMAAMGAQPRGMVLGVAAAPKTRVEDLLNLVRTVNRVGRRFGAPLVGGDLSGIDGPLTVSVTVLGEVENKRALRRHRGRAGEYVVVTGTLGRAAAGLELLGRGESGPASLIKAQLRPEPQVELGLALGRAGVVSSCADLSDGLLRDVTHVLEPGCGVSLFPNQVPILPGVKATAEKLGASALQWAVSGGEDFELVMTVPEDNLPRALELGWEQGVRMTVVGRVRSEGGVDFPGGASMGAGFEHFVG